MSVQGVQLDEDCVACGTLHQHLHSPTSPTVTSHPPQHPHSLPVADLAGLWHSLHSCGAGKGNPSTLRQGHRAQPGALGLCRCGTQHCTHSKTRYGQRCVLRGLSVLSKPHGDLLHVLFLLPHSCQVSWHGTLCPVQLMLLPYSPCLLSQVIGTVPQDLLTAWPRPVHYLQVILWVPVGIKDDAGVGSGQVDAQPTCPCAQEKDKAIRVGLAEAVDGSLAQISTHPPVNALIGVPAQEEGEGRAESQWGLKGLWLSNPFLLLLPGYVGTPARTYWQDLCRGGGPGPISLHALWLFPKVVPPMMTKSSQPHAWCMDMGLTGTRTKGRLYFHLVTLRTSPRLHKMKGLSCLALGSLQPPAADGNLDPLVCGHGMAKSPACVVATPCAVHGGTVEEPW